MSVIVVFVVVVESSCVVHVVGVIRQVVESAGIGNDRLFEEASVRNDEWGRN